MTQFNELSQAEEMERVGQEITLLYEEFKDSGYEVMTSVDQQYIALQIFRENVRELDDLMNEPFLPAIDTNDPEGLKKLEAGLEMESGIDETFSAVEAYISEADPIMQQNALEAQSKFEQFADIYRATSLSVYEESWLNAINNDFKETVDAGNALIVDTDNLNSQIAQFEQGFIEINDYMDSQALPLIHVQTTKAINNARNSSETAHKWLLSLSILAILFGCLFALAISRSIKKGFKDIFRGIEKITNGKLDHRLNVDAKGEFGQLAIAFNRMLNDLGRSVDTLRRNEEMAWALLNASGEAAVLIDTRGIVLASNNTAAKKYNMKDDEFIGKCLYDLLPADLSVTRKLQVAQVIHTNKPLNFEEESAGRTLEHSLYPILGMRGKVARVAVFAHDITVRIWVNELMDQLGQQNDMILKSAGEGIYGVDTKGITIFVNPAAARMLGYEPDELIGKSHHEIVHHTKPNGTPYPPHQCPIYAAFKDGIVHIGDDEVFWRKDGTSFPVVYTSTPMIDKGQIVGAVVTYQDITERKRLEDALRESEQKYRSIFESIANMVVSVDEDGRIVDCNNRVKQILGYTPNEVIGQSLVNIVHPDYSLKAKETLHNVLSNGFEYNKSYKMVKKDGKPIEVSMNAVVVRNDRGEYVRTICMISDSAKPVQV